MAQDYMAALIVLSADQDRKEARTKLLESIGNDAVIDVVNRCLKLEVSEEALVEIASMTLDSLAAQSFQDECDLAVQVHDSCSQSDHRKASKENTTCSLENPPLVNEQRDQKNDEEDILFLETDVDINTPFENAGSAQVFQTRLAESTVTAPDEKAMIMAHRRQARRRKVAPAQSTSMKSTVSADAKKKRSAVAKEKAYTDFALESEKSVATRKRLRATSTTVPGFFQGLSSS